MKGEQVKRDGGGGIEPNFDAPALHWQVPASQRYLSGASDAEERAYPANLDANTNTSAPTTMR